MKPKYVVYHSPQRGVLIDPMAVRDDRKNRFVVVSESDEGYEPVAYTYDRIHAYSIATRLTKGLPMNDFTGLILSGRK
jgi:hypothetical protein